MENYRIFYFLKKIHLMKLRIMSNLKNILMINNNYPFVKNGYNSNTNMDDDIQMVTLYDIISKDQENEYSYYNNNDVEINDENNGQNRI